MLRAVRRHLRDSGKSASALDAMLVCHIAGCGRVTGKTGVPRAGEAGCAHRCAALVARYLDRSFVILSARLDGLSCEFV
jgi:hypothetical protein